MICSGFYIANEHFGTFGRENDLCKLIDKLLSLKNICQTCITDGYNPAVLLLGESSFIHMLPNLISIGVNNVFIMDINNDVYQDWCRNLKIIRQKIFDPDTATDIVQSIAQANFPYNFFANDRCLKHRNIFAKENIDSLRSVSQALQNSEIKIHFLQANLFSRESRKKVSKYIEDLRCQLVVANFSNVPDYLYLYFEKYHYDVKYIKEFVGKPLLSMLLEFPYAENCIARVCYGQKCIGCASPELRPNNINEIIAHQHDLYKLHLAEGANASGLCLEAYGDTILRISMDVETFMCDYSNGKNRGSSTSKILEAHLELAKEANDTQLILKLETLQQCGNSIKSEDGKTLVCSTAMKQVKGCCQYESKILKDEIQHDGCIENVDIENPIISDKCQRL